MALLQAGSRTVDLELTTLSSTHHVELNPSDDGFQEQYIVQEIIKEMAKNRPIDVKGKKGFKGLQTSILIYVTSVLPICSCCFIYAVSVLVLNEVDKLSREAQHSLRRTIENFRATETS